jgi:nucleotidyltransferase substrate binding protein (TIGR01987 family)
MEKITLMSQTTGKALKTLKEIIQTLYSIIVRDSTIQRFEYCFEISWKFLKEYLRIHEGIICNSPKSCFREAFKVNLLTEEETIKALEMTDDRNLTSHTYHEELADEIYRKIPEYYALMEKVYSRIKTNQDNQASNFDK